MSSLEWQPAFSAPDAVTDALFLCCGMVSIHKSGNGRKGRRTESVKQFVYVLCDAVEVVVAVNFSEMRSLNVPPLKVRFRRYDLVHAATTSAGLEHEVAFIVRLSVADRNRTNQARRLVSLIDHPGISHMNITAPETPFAMPVCVQTL
jgi:hypothetical protein